MGNRWWTFDYRILKLAENFSLKALREEALRRLISLPSRDMQVFLDQLRPWKGRKELPLPKYANRNIFSEDSLSLDNVSTSKVDDHTLRYDFFSQGFAELIRALNGEDPPRGDEAKHIQAAIVAESCKPIGDRFEDIGLYQSLARDIPSFNQDLVMQLARGFHPRFAKKANHKDRTNLVVPKSKWFDEKFTNPEPLYITRLIETVNPADEDSETTLVPSEFQLW